MGIRWSWIADARVDGAGCEVGPSVVKTRGARGADGGRVAVACSRRTGDDAGGWPGGDEECGQRGWSRHDESRKGAGEPGARAVDDVHGAAIALGAVT